MIRRALGRTPRRAWWAALVVVAVAAVVVGVAVGRQTGTAIAPVPATEPAPPPPGFVRYRDPEAGFSIAHPAGWRRLRTGSSGVRLLAEGADGASLLVRTTPLGEPVGTRGLSALRRLTARIVASGRGVKLIGEPRRITLDGRPGFFYLYSFRDGRGQGARRGTHSHYFVFDGETMVTLVLQAVPAARFARHAPVFDRIVQSFRFVSR